MLQENVDVTKGGQAHERITCPFMYVTSSRSATRKLWRRKLFTWNSLMGRGGRPLLTSLGNSLYESSMDIVTSLYGRNILRPVVPSCGALHSDVRLVLSKLFLQALLTKIWWGAMTTDTAISKLVVSFFCPALIWTNLIKFRWSVWSCPSICLSCVDVLCVFLLCALTLSYVFLSDEELDNRNDREQFVELDSLDTEKALLLTDDDDPLWVFNQITQKLLLNNLKIIFVK